MSDLAVPPSVPLGPTPPALDATRVRLVFGGLLLVMLLAALDSTIVSTALPTIVGEFGGLERLSWVVTAYLLAQTVVTPLYGKLGDLYGRKRVLQVGVVIFLAGSALCGASQSMTGLIVFRAIQGLGGGGLMVTTQAVVGDIVSPRDRGRYQGIFGAVFGLASVAGPLLGGYFTTHLSWRWIFYVNLPLGLLALFVIAATLPAQATRVRHRVDYAGATLLAVLLTAVILATDLGGTAYAWSSPLVVGLLATSVLALGAFVAVERRAAEPVLPLRLFRNRSFWVTSSVGLVVGFALFGSVTYLPLYLQVAKDATPTASGLQMLPMMGGMLVTSILSGQLISRTGRYKVFPVVGTGVMAAGLFWLSHLRPETSPVEVSLMMLSLGLGLGMVMQVLVVAVQNDVPYEDLGVATSGVTLFRSIGGSVGTAALGAIFAASLGSRLAALLPDGTAGVPPTGAAVQTLATLAPAVRAAYAEAYTGALDTVLIVATGIALVGFAMSWLLPEKPLRRTVAAAGEDAGRSAGEAFAMPRTQDPLALVLPGLIVLADRDVRRKHIEAVVERAGIALSAAAAWSLVRLEEDASATPETLAVRHEVPLVRLREAFAELTDGGLIVPAHASRHTLTDTGCATYDRLAHARREHLGEILADWSPEQRRDVAARLERLARDLTPEATRPDTALLAPRRGVGGQSQGTCGGARPNARAAARQMRRGSRHGPPGVRRRRGGTAATSRAAWLVWPPASTVTV